MDVVCVLAVLKMKNNNQLQPICTHRILQFIILEKAFYASSLPIIIIQCFASKEESQWNVRQEVN